MEKDPGSATGERQHEVEALRATVWRVSSILDLDTVLGEINGGARADRRPLLHVTVDRGQVLVAKKCACAYQRTMRRIGRRCLYGARGPGAGWSRPRSSGTEPAGFRLASGPQDQTPAELAELAKQIETLLVIETADAAGVRLGRRLAALLNPEGSEEVPRLWLEGCIWVAARASGLERDQWQCVAGAQVLRTQRDGWEQAVLRVIGGPDADATGTEGPQSANPRNAGSCRARTTKGAWVCTADPCSRLRSMTVSPSNRVPGPWKTWPCRACTTRGAHLAVSLHSRRAALSSRRLPSRRWLARAASPGRPVHGLADPRRRHPPGIPWRARCKASDRPRPSSLAKSPRSR